MLFLKTIRLKVLKMLDMKIRDETDSNRKSFESLTNSCYFEKLVRSSITVQIGTLV